MSVNMRNLFTSTNFSGEDCHSTCDMNTWAQRIWENQLRIFSKDNILLQTQNWCFLHCLSKIFPNSSGHYYVILCITWDTPSENIQILKSQLLFNVMNDHIWIAIPWLIKYSLLIQKFIIKLEEYNNFIGSKDSFAHSSIDV